MSKETQRKIAAILSADVAGYSRLMSEDENGTLAALRSLRDHLTRLVDDNRGNIVKSMGDGWLIEFASVVDAANCAIGVQAQLKDNDVIELRIGIHIGDIVHEDDDIFGDGVNVASRLQEVATPGGVALSSRAHEFLDDKSAELFTNAGIVNLKNIAEPVRVYAVGGVKSAGSELPLPDKPSIVVLPFDNLSADKEQEYLADGVVEELTSALSRIHNLFVIARNTAFTYKNKENDIRAVAAELGVRYVLEGSVRRSSSRIRVTVQLIDGADGDHMWASKFDRDIDDLFVLQDDITAAIVGQIHPTIRDAEIRRARRQPPDSSRAYDLTMRAFPFAWSLDSDDANRAIELLKEAVEIDPDYALAYAIWSWCEGQKVVYQWTDDTDMTVEKAIDLASKAYVLDPNDPTVLTCLATAQTFARRLAEAGDNLERALKLDPNSAWAWARYGWLQYYTGNGDEGIRAFRNAMRLSPLDPMNFNCYIGLGAIQSLMGEYDEGIANIERGMREHPLAVWANRILCAAYALNGQLEEAQKCRAQLETFYPELTATAVVTAIPFTDTAFIERYQKGLVLSGLPER
jgi:adenylate cyclase